MSEQSKTLEIMRRIGAPIPEKIRITGIIQSPELAAFFLGLPGEDSDSLTELLSLLGSHEVNIRFISKYYDATGNSSVCLCIDPGPMDLTLELIDTNASSLGIRDFSYRAQVRVISIYPHKERARVVERLFTTLRVKGIEPLAVNNASSVVSCVLNDEYVEQALSCLNDAFELP